MVGPLVQVPPVGGLLARMNGLALLLCTSEDVNVQGGVPNHRHHVLSGRISRIHINDKICRLNCSGDHTNSSTVCRQVAAVCPSSC